jgi:parallel beta-helix repeat protein
LQAVLTNALPGDTISVNGTCTENVLVRNEKQRLTLDGGGSAAIDGPNSTEPTVNVRGKGILIQGFTITGGRSGIEVDRAVNAVINDNTIQNTGGHGIAVDQLGFAAIINNTIQNNPGAGIVVSEESAARIGFNDDAETAASSNTIQNNAIGVLVMNSSSVRVVGNTISNNVGDGVVVMRRSSADISSNNISSNGGDGVSVRENSTVHLGEDSGASIYELPNTTINNNGTFGVECSDGAIADGRRGSLNGTNGPISFDGNCINDLIP